MDTLQKTVLIGHTLIALLIIVLVLLQRGKGADAGAAFGAGASGTVFGARGSGSFFSRATAILAAAFFASSLGLAYLSSQNTAAPSSLLEDAPAVEEAAEEFSAMDDRMSVSEMPWFESEGGPAEDVTGMPAIDESGDAESADSQDRD